MTFLSFLYITDSYYFLFFQEMVLVICSFRSSLVSIKFLECDCNHLFCPTFAFLLQGHQICVSCILTIEHTHLTLYLKAMNNESQSLEIKSFLAAWTVCSLWFLDLLSLLFGTRTTYCNLSDAVTLFLF